MGVVHVLPDNIFIGTPFKKNVFLRNNVEDIFRHCWKIHGSPSLLDDKRVVRYLLTCLPQGQVVIFK